MGSCANYKTNVCVKVKAIKDDNGVLCKEKKLVLSGKGFSREKTFNLFRELKKDFLITDDEGIIDTTVTWKDEYENMPLEQFKEEFYDEAFCEFYTGDDSKYYNVEVYALSEYKVDKKQLELLSKEDKLLENGYIVFKTPEFWKEIYYEADNRTYRDITFELSKIIKICLNNNFEYRVIIEGDGYC